MDGTTIYNLGFGDYYIETGKIADNSNSNNGDMRKVFSTVLNSIPDFFCSNENVAVWVQGSDSSDDFKETCKKSCSRNCTQICRNMHKRIKIYSYYIDKNFEELKNEYLFFGQVAENNAFSSYVPNKNYIGILIFKKN